MQKNIYRMMGCVYLITICGYFSTKKALYFRLYLEINHSCQMGSLFIQLVHLTEQSYSSPNSIKNLGIVPYSGRICFSNICSK